MSRRPAPSRPRRWLFRAATLGTLVALGLVGAELSLRWRARSERPWRLTPAQQRILDERRALDLAADPDAGRAPLALFSSVPGLEYRMPIRVSPTEHGAVSSWGYSRFAWPDPVEGDDLPKPATVYRVAFNGDSVLAGQGVADPEAIFTARVERDVNASPRVGRSGRRLEALNFGLSGYNFSSLYANVGFAIEPTHPDLVVYVLFWNDVLDSRMLEVSISGDRKCGGEHARDLATDPPGPVTYLWSFLRTRSYLVHRIVYDLQPRLSYGADPVRMLGRGDRTLDVQGSEVLVPNWLGRHLPSRKGCYDHPMAAATLDRMIDAIQGFADVLILHVPLMEDVVAARADTSLDLVRWLAAEHPEVELISLRPDFELAVESGLDLDDLTVDGAHLTPAGHRIVADALAPILERRLLAATSR